MTTLGDAFVELNKLEQDGVISKYAVAGGMAFLFYTDPVNTYDLDVFVYLPKQEGDGLIISMSPLYDELRKRGHTFDGEHVKIAGIVVQFIVAYSSLAEEALDQAVIHDYEGVPVRVISPEHLVALAYDTGGAKRRERAQAMLDDEGVVNLDRLKQIMEAHNVSTEKKNA